MIMLCRTALLLIGCLCWAQLAQQPAGNGSVEGRVINRVTQEPLRKATVRLANSGRGIQMYEASTDASGNFRIEHVPPGTYRVNVERTGFTRGLADLVGAQGRGTISVAPDQQVKDVLIPMTPHSVVTGQVTDEDNDPLQNASVQLWRLSYVGGKRQLMPSNGANTNDLGEYRLAGITPGKYYLSARKQNRDWRPGMNRRPEAGGTETDYLAVFYPDARDASTSTPLELTVGQTLNGMDLRLRKVPVSRVRGRVVNAGGSGSMVFLLSNVPGRFSTMGLRPVPVSPQDGSFEFRGVVPGSYTLVATRGGRGGTRAQGRVDISVGEGLLEGVEVQMRDPFAVNGQLAAEGVEAQSLAGVAIQLMPLESMSMVPPPVARPKEDGSFILNDALPDRYRINLQGLPEGYWVKSVRYGEQEVYETGVDLSAGPGGEFRIVAVPGAGVIDGLVRNSKGEPLPGAVVTLAPAKQFQNWTEMYRYVTADQIGVFRMAGLRPGEYRVHAWEQLEMGAHQDPEILAKFDAEGTKVEIKAGGREGVELKAIPADLVSAR
ncbi:MAG: carboxypeptidase regulatory-like domain-containing protein [Acidobacteriia bacterium]|nr:carboxypeptidase regulatory-like domain-containing protein [Terriglobia bacterium]